MTKSIIKNVSLLIGIFAVCAFANNNTTVTLAPSAPSHYLYSPMARVTPANHLVLGLREMSYGLPGNLAVQLSLVDNIGKTNLAAKFGLANNLSIGAGLASTFVSMGDVGIHRDEARLGLFLTYALADRNNFSMAITPHTQIANRWSIGADFGLMATPTDTWSFLWEAGLSVDTYDDHWGGIYPYTVGALRIHPPAVPFLFIDFGVGTNQFNAKQESPKRMRARAFIDIMVCFIAH